MATIYLIAAIIFTAMGILSMIAAEAPETPWWVNLIAWVILSPAFYALLYSMEGYGVVGSIALWGAGTIILIVLQGICWGDNYPIGRRYPLASFWLAFWGWGLVDKPVQLVSSLYLDWE